MKCCPYCGKEYPDDTQRCAIDHTPLDGNATTNVIATSAGKPSQKFFQRFGEFGIISEQKIPLSLSIVSYLYFLPGAAFLALSAALPTMFLLLFFQIFSTTSNTIFMLSLCGDMLLTVVLMLLLLAFPKTMLIPAVGFCLYVVIYHLGPIHDKSDTWSNLVYIWLCIGSFFLSRGLRRGSRGWRTCALMLTWWAMLSTVGGAIWYFFSHDTHKRMDMSPITFFTCSIIYFLFSAWQYRVLTRQDVRELFGL